jgi:hypothetical protein
MYRFTRVDLMHPLHHQRSIEPPVPLCSLVGWLLERRCYPNTQNTNRYFP